MKNVAAAEGSQQPVTEGNPLPLFSNSAALLNSGVTVPSVAPPVQSMVQIQVGSFFDYDPNLQSRGTGSRKRKRGVYESGFDGSGEPLTTPVRIISKPTPIYSDEGLRLRIQGEVVIDVEFRADGKTRVFSVVRGLGHGLDEAAVTAIEGIRFKPASINGQSVDFQGRAHVEFSLMKESSKEGNN
jgi:TonB family protein